LLQSIRVVQVAGRILCGVRLVERILRSVLPMPRPCVDRDVMIGWQLKVPLRLQRAKKCSLCGALL
jgi:hypothetical protein